MCSGKCDHSFVAYVRTKCLSLVGYSLCVLCVLDRTNIETQSLTLVDYILCVFYSFYQLWLEYLYRFLYLHPKCMLV
jgi:hypothetical protein